MEDGERADLAAELRARLAAAGLGVPADDAGRMERDLGLHLERMAALAAAADLGPADPPFTTLPPRPPGEPGTAPPAGVPGSRPAAASAGADPGQARPVATASAPAAPAPRPGDLGGLGLVEAARLVREGAASSAELVEAALARIEALDGRLGAFVTLLPGDARTEAAARDLQRRRGETLGPLHGVPVAVKDLVDVAGTVTGAGSPKLAGNLAARDAEVVARLRAAGAVVVGKTRTHEFAYGVLTPGTMNPWDETRIAGGSSGGSAAAVAAGLVPAAVGTDTAGSVRIPAACCGVVGFKPSLGRVPAAGVWPLSWTSVSLRFATEQLRAGLGRHPPGQHAAALRPRRGASPVPARQPLQPQPERKHDHTEDDHRQHHERKTHHRPPPKWGQCRHLPQPIERHRPRPASGGVARGP